MMGMKIRLLSRYEKLLDISLSKTIIQDADYIGEAVSVLSEIVHRPSATVLEIMNKKTKHGILVIRCEELENSDKVVSGCIVGVNLPKNCFYYLSHILFVCLLVCLFVCLFENHFGGHSYCNKEESNKVYYHIFTFIKTQFLDFL